LALEGGKLYCCWRFILNKSLIWGIFVLHFAKVLFECNILDISFWRVNSQWCQVSSLNLLWKKVMRLWSGGIWILRQPKKAYWGALFLLAFCVIEMKLRGYFSYLYLLLCVKFLASMDLRFMSYVQNTTGIWR